MVGLLVIGLLQFMMPGPLLHSLHSSLGVLLFCGYLVVNTQMMMGGGKQRQLRPDEHIMAAVQIYTDIIGIFLHVLSSMARDE